MYVWGLGGLIYCDIAPTPRLFFVRGKKETRGQGSARGPKARGHCPARGFFFAEDEIKPRWRRLYRCIQPDENHIYNKYTTSLSVKQTII